MTYRLLLDENIEYQTRHRLRSHGHDTEHVDDLASIGKGSDDHSIAAYCTRETRLVVTYDDDFVLEIDESAHDGVLYVNDATVSAKAVADAIHRLSSQYPQPQIRDVVHLDQWM